MAIFHKRAHILSGENKYKNYISFFLHSMINPFIMIEYNQKVGNLSGFLEKLFCCPPNENLHTEEIYWWWKSTKSFYGQPETFQNGQKILFSPKSSQRIFIFFISSENGPQEKKITTHTLRGLWSTQLNIVKM